ncbi:porin family protein [Taibaiella chishuiensis]|uniref:Outer membrane protein with beta-barrel domain n=1 Tax=Taibaiella chishuiensis TaxID=1434707 RepID=A0A2P8D315_9BACT|nr:porin family protein [Taibaiella chishuiensis]PSK91566.1 outer membrane protein with beta-barrel domain [Taibaiella chishuiensis]
MTKNIAYTLLFLVLSSGAYAQLGITAGANIGKYHYGESRFDVHRKVLLSFNAGLQYKKKLNGHLFLLPELSFTQKGTRVYYDYPIGYTGPMKNTNRLNYIQLTLPVMAAIPVSDDLDYEIGGGLYMAYLVKAIQQTFAFDGNSAKHDFTSGAFKKLDVGLHLTTGFRMGKKLGLHVHYDFGLTNIEGLSNSPSVKNRNCSINMSWLFAKHD